MWGDDDRESNRATGMLDIALFGGVIRVRCLTFEVQQQTVAWLVSIGHDVTVHHCVYSSVRWNSAVGRLICCNASFSADTTMT